LSRRACPYCVASEPRAARRLLAGQLDQRVDAGPGGSGDHGAVAGPDLGLGRQAVRNPRPEFPLVVERDAGVDHRSPLRQEDRRSLLRMNPPRREKVSNRLYSGSSHRASRLSLPTITSPSRRLFCCQDELFEKAAILVADPHHLAPLLTNLEFMHKSFSPDTRRNLNLLLQRDAK
jgi:hypothetical protein